MIPSCQVVVPKLQSRDSKLQRPSLFQTKSPFSNANLSFGDAEPSSGRVESPLLKSNPLEKTGFGPKTHCFAAKKRGFVTMTGYLLVKQCCIRAKTHCFVMKRRCFATKRRCFTTKARRFTTKRRCFATKAHCFVTKGLGFAMKTLCCVTKPRWLVTETCCFANDCRLLTS